MNLNGGKFEVRARYRWVVDAVEVGCIGVGWIFPKVFVNSVCIWEVSCIISIIHGAYCY